MNCPSSCDCISCLAETDLRSPASMSVALFHTLLSILDLNTFSLRVKTGQDLLLIMLSKHLSLTSSDLCSNS